MHWGLPWLTLWIPFLAVETCLVALQVVIMGLLLEVDELVKSKILHDKNMSLFARWMEKRQGQAYQAELLRRVRQGYTPFAHFCVSKMV